MIDIPTRFRSACWQAVTTTMIRKNDSQGPRGSLQAARAAKPKALETFRKMASVCGVGITRIDGDYGLKINLTEPPARDCKIPDRIDGVKIRVEVTGPVRKH